MGVAEVVVGVADHGGVAALWEYEVPEVSTSKRCQTYVRWMGNTRIQHLNRLKEARCQAL